MRRTRLLAVFGLSLLGACFESPNFQRAETQIDVRVLPEGNGFALLYVERGIYGGTNAKNALDQILARKRLLPPHGGWLSFDFDEEEARLLQGDSLPDLLRDISQLEFFRGTTVERAGLFEDETGRLSLFQVWRFAKPEFVFRWLNENTNKNLLEKASSRKAFEPEFPFLDEESWNRAVASARAGWTWVHPDQEAILIDLPITRACAMKCSQEIVLREDLRQTFLPTLGTVAAIEIGDDRTRIRLLGNSTGWFRLLRLEESCAYDDQLHEDMKAAHIPIGSLPRLTDIDELVKVPPRVPLQSK
jgi:hypothetical protein